MAVTKGFDFGYMWTLSSLTKAFTNESKVTATFPKYYSAELGAGLRCMVGPNVTALVDTYCKVAKGNDLRLEVFG